MGGSPVPPALALFTTLASFVGEISDKVGGLLAYKKRARAQEPSLGNLTPADIYFGRGQTIERRRLLNRKAAA